MGTVLHHDTTLLNTEGNGLIRGKDGKTRCFWVGEDALYQHYHDYEWGKPNKDDRKLFEKLSLEGFQAGLSWITILRKRETFRQAFDDFDFHKIALYQHGKIRSLMQNKAIIRHAGKINAVINNAQKAIKLVDEFGSLANYFWSFQPQSSRKQERISFTTYQTVTTSPESQQLAKDLKRRGWRFVGPTTCYAFMQAMGLVNDHITGCDFGECEK